MSELEGFAFPTGVYPREVQSDHDEDIVIGAVESGRSANDSEWVVLRFRGPCIRDFEERHETVRKSEKLWRQSTVVMRRSELINVTGLLLAQPFEDLSVQEYAAFVDACVYKAKNLIRERHRIKREERNRRN